MIEKMRLHCPNSKKCDIITVICRLMLFSGDNYAANDLYGAG